MKRVASIIISGVIMLSLTAYTIAVDDHSNAKTLTEADIIRDYYIDQSSAIIAYNNFTSTLNRSSEGEYMWPSDFGGAYIDDNANLVIHVKNLNEDKRLWYENACQDDGASGGTGTAAAGDSGGPIYRIVNNTRYLVGFVIGGPNGGSYQYASRADLQLSKLGASIYTG